MDLGAAFEAVLPPEVDDLLLQGDLTGIVPGGPSRTLERLVEVAANVVRGAATTVRFTPESVLRALDRGARPTSCSPSSRRTPDPMPQPLEYLVRDTARRHGRVRVGPSSHAAPPRTRCSAGIAEDPALRGLGLVLLALAPRRLRPAHSRQLQDALRARGVPSVVEGPDGRVLVSRTVRAVATCPTPRARPGEDGPGRSSGGAGAAPGPGSCRAPGRGSTRPGTGPGVASSGSPTSSPGCAPRTRARRSRPGPARPAGHGALTATGRAGAGGRRRAGRDAGTTAP